MINESNIVCLYFFKTSLCSLIGIIIKKFIYLFKTENITFLSYILFELLDFEHGSPLSYKNVKCNSPGLALAIDHPSPRGNLYTMIS